MKRRTRRRTPSCKYVATYTRKSEATAHAKDLRSHGYRARTKKVAGATQVLSCGKAKRARRKRRR